MWKLVSSGDARSCDVFEFQKDLIVWKRLLSISSISLSLLFQKDLIVWKQLIARSQCFTYIKVSEGLNSVETRSYSR